MKELWVKKTIWRRYLINDIDIAATEQTIEGDPEQAEVIIGDCYDQNKSVEYDDEKFIFPIEFTIQPL